MGVADDALAGDPRQVGSGIWAALVEAALPSLRLEHSGGRDPASPTTRLGGQPLVDAAFVWPHTYAGNPLSLVGQLNCDEINEAAGDSALPPGSLVAFFYEVEGQQRWGFDPADGQYWRVVRSDAATTALADPPSSATTFPALALTPHRVLTVPEPWEPPVVDLWEADRDGVDAAYETITVDTPSPRHRVFGWPELVQNPMQLECQLASNGIYVGGPDGYRDSRVEGLRPGAADWRLLWQVDTDDVAGWMWGDVGTIYYWIRGQDLATGAFDRVWMVFQCC